MIIDSSALVAVFRKEPETQPLLKCLFEERGIIPAPVAVEYHRVVTRRGSRPADAAETFLRELLAGEIMIGPFTPTDADLASAANAPHGSGNGLGGTLNLLDLMVYGMARRMDLPILCTGRDFAATGIAIHPASRGW